MTIFALALFPALAALGVMAFVSLEYALRGRPLARPVDVRHAILHERTLVRVSAR